MNPALFTPRRLLLAVPPVTTPSPAGDLDAQEAYALRAQPIGDPIEQLRRLLLTPPAGLIGPVDELRRLLFEQRAVDESLAKRLDALERQRR